MITFGYGKWLCQVGVGNVSHKLFRKVSNYNITLHNICTALPLLTGGILASPVLRLWPEIADDWLYICQLMEASS